MKSKCAFQACLYRCFSNTFCGKRQRCAVIGSSLEKGRDLLW